MITLGIDCSAVSASCAVTEDGRILAYAAVNVRITHSQTLLPLIESVLKAASLTLDGIDRFAVTNGPGSFTGLRIGISTIKGMAFAENKPVCGVSTLFSLGYNLIGRNCIASAVMDARRGEVYNALFEINGDDVTRLTEDRAISLDDLGEELSQYTESEIVLVGDGAALAYEHFGGSVSIAPEIIRFQNAASVCLCDGEYAPPKFLMPVYLRKPQAQRELDEKLGTAVKGK